MYLRLRKKNASRILAGKLFGKNYLEGRGEGTMLLK
jgi:hypothetical protein